MYAMCVVYGHMEGYIGIHTGELEKKMEATVVFLSYGWLFGSWSLRAKGFRGAKVLGAWDFCFRDLGLGSGVLRVLVFCVWGVGFWVWCLGVWA